MTANSLPALREVMTPQSFEQAVSFSQMVSKTQFVPQAFRGKPDECLAAITYGAELGLSPMQALRGVAVINGAPAVYGDTMLAVCQSHPQWAGKEEWLEGEGDARTAHCVVKRKGEPDVHATFSVADAKEAQLWSKQGPWKQYPTRMLKMRARSFALRDQFSDALRGVIAVEEAGDYQHVGPDRARDVTPKRENREQPLDKPEYIPLYSAHGEEFLIEPGEVDEWIKNEIAGATDEELQALAGNNAGNDDVTTIVREVADARLAKNPAQEPPPQTERPQDPAEPDPEATRAAGANNGKAQEARDRFMARLKTCDDLTKLAELQQKLGQYEKGLGEYYQECAEALDVKKKAMLADTDHHDAFAELEPEEWKGEEGRVEDERQQELIE